MTDNCTSEPQSLPTHFENLKPPETFGKTIRLLGWPKTLSWDNFEKVSKPKKMPDKYGQMGFSASTQFNTAFTGVRITPKQVITKTALGSYRLKDLIVSVELDANYTWVIRGKETPALLAHEQGHYDIAGLIARELHWRLDLLHSIDPCQLDRWIGDTKNLVGNKFARANDKYDVETKHSENQERQQFWNQLILSCMNENKPLPDPRPTS